MNAVVETTRAPVAAPHATHKFKLLLRREFWEHKGGFFWAPLVAGGISLLLTIMAIIVGEVVARKAIAAGKFQGDSDVTINGLDLGKITSKMGAEEMQHLARWHRPEHAGGVQLAIHRAGVRGVLLLPRRAVRRAQGPQRAVLEVAAAVGPRHRVVEGRQRHAGRPAARRRCRAADDVRLPAGDQRRRDAARRQSRCS